MVDRSRLDHRDGIIFLSPIDGRVLFILPWRDLSYIGTTDTDTVESPDQLEVTPDEMVYLLRSANARFPNARLGLEDVRGAWAGLRPLLADTAATTESGRSREHAIVQGSGGMITVVGGQAHHLPLDGEGGGGPGGARAPVPRGQDRVRPRPGPTRSRCPAARPTTSPSSARGGWSWGWCRRASST